MKWCCSGLVPRDEILRRFSVSLWNLRQRSKSLNSIVEQNELLVTHKKAGVENHR